MYVRTYIHREKTGVFFPRFELAGVSVYKVFSPKNKLSILVYAAEREFEMNDGRASGLTIYTRVPIIKAAKLCKKSN